MDIKAHLKANWKLSIPIVTGQLGQIGTNIADNMMVGNSGSSQIAAAALANGIFFFFFVIGIGFSMASSPLVAESKAQNKILKCVAYLKNSLLANIGLAILLGAVIYIISLFLEDMGQAKHIVSLAQPYIKVQCISLFPVLFYFAFKQFFEGLSITKPAMIITLGGNAINIFLNWVFIFGHFGFDAMGLYGAGIATLISRVLMALAIGIYFFKSQSFKIYSDKISQVKLNASILRKLSKMGFPIGFQFAIEVSAFGGASILAGWINEASMAAHQVALNLVSISWSIATGFGAAVTVRMGEALGKRQYDQLKNINYSGYILSLSWMVITGILFFVFGYELSSLYLQDESIILLASQLIFVGVLFQISDGAQIIGQGALRGLQDVNATTWISLISFWIIGIPLGYIFGFYYNLGIEGVWYGLFAGLTCSAILLFFRFKRIVLIHLK
ncbi:MAG: MATE family efflux transporter [Flavobacteriales bacterium]